MSLGEIKVVLGFFVHGCLCACIPRDPWALLSILCIWVVTGVLVHLACERLLYPNYQIQATLMIIVSSCAVAANIM